MKALNVEINSDNFDWWTGGRNVAQPGSNVDSKHLPFQSWRPFKEAFAPEIVKRAISESIIDVKHVLDPFGGSGTSALTSKFLGVRATTIEVNPYLADLIKSKLATYRSDILISSYSQVISSATERKSSAPKFSHFLPPTFVEPGVNGRYIFSKNAARTIGNLLWSIKSLPCPLTARLFSILLATSAVEKSNIFVSGKGRRYKKNWQSTVAAGDDIIQDFSSRALAAIRDITEFSDISRVSTKVINDDVRTALGTLQEDIDLCVFSPPYPNSFDYTDVYNVELWLLGYFNNFSDNRNLRRKTLRSHVSVKRDFSYQKLKSRSLSLSLRALERKRDFLWNKGIPEMVGAYFDDMYQIFGELESKMPRASRIYCVVGDSKYADIPVPVAKIFEQMLRPTRWELVNKEQFRSMKCSPQQGANHELPETLLVFQKV